MSTGANRSGALAQTPSRPLHVDAVPTPDSTGGRGQSHWGEVKTREEYDFARSRLSDQNFSMRDYPDPLLPRTTNSERFYPQGTTVETENHLVEFMAKIKAGQKP